MLLRALFARDTAQADTDLAFRSRGTEVSRLEGFSDAVFGFAITLLVISSKVPDTIGELLSMWHAIIPFVVSFAVLFFLWRAQFDFFRRYGLEDRRTIRLTGVLLGIVLLAVYPVRFVATAMFDVVPVALLRGNDSMKAMITIADVPKVILLYTTGFAGVSFVFMRLYAHAATQHAVIGLSELELFDTRAIQRRWLAMTISSVMMMAWCMLLIVAGMRTAKRDIVWTTVYMMGPLVVLAMNLVQRRTHRRLGRERQALVSSLAAPAGPRPVVIS
jgi:uncharacterized membrane protein